ncbi:MAG: DUF1538 domain-containing protein [Magnetococcales bacterium]|nr:DUF1538 domain-containing protein [Magnetococcales bacterium]
MPSIRYGQYLRDTTLVAQSISYNKLAPGITRDTQGKIIPYVAQRIRLQGVDIYRLLKNYTKDRFLEQVKAVLPLAIYMSLFQIFILNRIVEPALSITFGMIGVIIGLMLFIEGLMQGLMPFGETIGNLLPKKSSLPSVLMIAFLLGVGVTFAEPAIGALKTAGQIVSVEKAPYLFALLNDWSGALVLMVGGGVGLAAVLGTLRFLYDWSLKPLIYLSVIPALLVTLYALNDPELEKILGLAWDCGGVTTGPVTVPLVLALGIGIASSAGKGNTKLSGFGIVTLASLFPVIGVMALAIYVRETVPVATILAAANPVATPVGDLPWHETSPGSDIVLGMRAILPLVAFLMLVLRVMLREKIANAGVVTYGIILTLLGMCIFNLGLTHGLSSLGAQTGGLLPGAFTHIPAMEESPLYLYLLGLMIVLLFSWLLGFGATLAEPALNALGVTVENLTQGVFKKQALIRSVSLGVAFGMAIGVAKIIFDLALAHLLIPAYLLALVLTHFSTEEFVNIGWDSAGVTTGPITVPLVLSIGLGVGGAVGVVEGFGILAVASICPIISVLSMGLLAKYRAGRNAREEAACVDIHA